MFKDQIYFILLALYTYAWISIPPFLISLNSHIKCPPQKVYQSMYTILSYHTNIALQV